MELGHSTTKQSPAGDNTGSPIDAGSPTLPGSKVNSNPPGVTTPPSDTYHINKDKGPQDSGVEFASEKSGGGLRGFLRKVTRNIEKRTNIKATDDDDRLLIAGLAIKMN
jgi:hypothetical protein